MNEALAKQCRHIWLKYIRDESVDLNTYDAKKVCKDCGEFIAYEPHKKDHTLLGHCQKLMREGRLSDWEKTLVTEFSKATELDAGKKRILERIAREDRRTK